MERNIDKKRLYLFLGIVFILSWGLVAIIPLTGDKYGSTKSLFILSALMLIPAISSILTRLITKEGFKVGYMYREEPSTDVPDSGWRFMAGKIGRAHV